MSKKLTKLTLAVLSFVCVLCMSIAVFSIDNAYASAQSTFVMTSGAQVREIEKETDRQGITFQATFKGTAPEGATFGMILVPADFLSEDSANWENELCFGNEDLPEYDSSKKDTYTKDSKYFARGENTLDHRGRLFCSFVGIQEQNFSRTFVARAYYRTGEAGNESYVYAEGISTATIYTVASKHLATAEAIEESVEEYLTNIVDTVLEEYTDIDVNVEGISNNEAYRDETISATATVSNAEGKVLESGVKPVLLRENKVVANTNYYDSEKEEFVLTTSGVYAFGVQIGSKVIADEEVEQLTVKRRGVIVKITPRNATVNWRTWEPIDDPTKVDYADFKYQKVDAMGNSVNLLLEVSDDENPSAKPNGYVLESEGNWLSIKSYSGASYLSADRNKTVNAISYLRNSYTDNYGVTYTFELPIYGRV